MTAIYDVVFWIVAIGVLIWAVAYFDNRSDRPTDHTDKDPS